MQGYGDVSLRTILKRSTEVHVHIRRHQGAKIAHYGISKVNYHNCLHGATSVMPSKENVDVMLDLIIRAKGPLNC